MASLAPLAFGVWTLVDYDGARGWEDQHGPVSLVLVLADRTRTRARTGPPRVLAGH